MKVALVARAVFPLHGYGGLERHVYDLARALLERDVEVTLITPPPAAGQDWSTGVDPPGGRASSSFRTSTFPLRGTARDDRARSEHGVSALRACAPDGGRSNSCAQRQGRHRPRLRRERARLRARPPSRPQRRRGRFGGRHGAAGAEPAGARRVRRDGSVARAAQARRVSAAAAGRSSSAPAAADAVIATDRSLEPVVLRHLGIPRERMRTIPNALDLRDAGRADRSGLVARPAAAPQARRSASGCCSSVGRLEASKGFHVLLRALAAVRDHGALDGRPWRWVALGDGPYRPMLEMLAEELGLEQHVHFLGRVTDQEMHAWHELSTLFVHPTLYEGSSLVTLEAMAHRRAVVASAAGGIPDKVRPGENGWLVAPGDPSALAAAISGAVADPARLAHYGLAGRAIVEREFSWAAAGDATVALYRELLG